MIFIGDFGIFIFILLLLFIGFKKFTFLHITHYLYHLNMELSINIINKSHHKLPDYQTSGSSGMDIRAFLPQAISLIPMERKLIPTGLFIALPTGYEAQIRPRSGMAIKKGITLINTPGTIDSDYRGEIMLPIINLSTETQHIEDGDRLAQMIIAKYEQIRWNIVEVLDETKRGEGGFGHSGVN